MVRTKTARATKPGRNAPAPSRGGKIPLHWVISTHWDREWYEPFQGFRYRLVYLLDEVLDRLEHDPRFTHFQMDGQSIPIEDYLEIRPEREEQIRRFAQAGRLAIGPWYTLPDEFIVAGESIVRNLAEGLLVARRFGEPSRAGFICDIFGHCSQLPQIFRGFRIATAFLWRGINEADVGRNFRWRAPDGSEVLAFRFGANNGYCDFYFRVRRRAHPADRRRQSLTEAAVEYLATQTGRPPAGLPVLFFDGCDHMELEPLTGELIEDFARRPEAARFDVRLSTLDAYAADLMRSADRITKTIDGELREYGKPPTSVEQQWLIPGVLSSRIHLKQANARCESLLTQWAEPFGLFTTASGMPDPAGFLRAAWRLLLQNHAHDSICGCSPDQVHKDMLYRFDQVELIADRIRQGALRHLARHVHRGLKPAPGAAHPPATLLLANPTARPIDEPVDFDVVLPEDTPCFMEWFGFEKKPAFTLHDERGREVAYQRVGQSLHQPEIVWTRGLPPKSPRRFHVHCTARLRIPPFGYTSLAVRPVEGFTRYGTTGLATSPTSAENEFLALGFTLAGQLIVTDKRTEETYEPLLTLENGADIGDGWYHGVPLNDQVHVSSAAPATVALVADGPLKAIFRVELEWTLPARFDFVEMRRSDERRTLRVRHDVTLRAGCDRIEVETTVENNLRDHRLRVLFPSGASAQTAWSDTPFDAVERPIALNPERIQWRELEVETRPQQSWTAVSDGRRGLAIVSHGLPEAAVRDLPERPIALTLLRAFRRTVMTRGEEGGQIQGTHRFRYWIVPLTGAIDPVALTRLGQRLAAGIGQAHHLPDMPPTDPERVDDDGAPLPRTHAYLRVEGEVIVSAVKAADDGRGTILRLFNPGRSAANCVVHRAGLKQAWRCDLEETPAEPLRVSRGAVELNLPSRRIDTLRLL
ncbi:MAG TPA: glycoside hydrolase family 38 C-terminal domain-containing protein [Candidatus Sumerlaeota bacterium]|nr:glycoside hydrolase family 38 C-terminal domain-containing protein [Candidatus Sumerlaeota bacterium]